MAKWTDIDDLSSEDVFDSRDIMEWMDEIRESIELEEGPDTDPDHRLMDDDELEAAKVLLAELEALAAEAGSEWPHGLGFISEGYFTEYAKDLAEDIGAIDESASWPARCIDWEAAAGELQQDYTAAEIGGTTFYYRA